jgi:hypothetical protein
MHRLRPVLVALAALLLTVLTTVTAGHAGAQPPPLPEDDPYFTAPASLASYAPGELIRARRVTVRAFELPVPADAWQALFRTSDRRGRPTVSVTTVIVPRAPWRGGGPRPLVSYQTAEDGVSTRCAPSYALTAGISGGFTGSYSESPLVVALLLKGWAVSVPDYEGMESQFLVADVAAKGVLDGLRAARQIRDARLARSPIGLWGYSGGAFASANAAQLQPRYAPELDIRAVALGGLLGDVRATIDAFSGSLVGGAIPMGIHGFDRAYRLDLRSYLNAFGKREYDASADLCVFEAVPRRPFLDIADIEAFPGALDRPEISAMLADNSPVNRRGAPTAPVYEYHARFDQMAPIGPARAVLSNYCRRGVIVEYREALVAEHLSELVLGAPGAVGFLDRMFRRMEPIDRCGAIPR